MKLPDFGLGALFEMTFVLILIFLILSKAQGLSTALGAFGDVYTRSIKALQGS